MGPFSLSSLLSCNQLGSEFTVLKVKYDSNLLCVLCSAICMFFFSNPKVSLSVRILAVSKIRAPALT